jgi:hypothetical protein
MNSNIDYSQMKTSAQLEEINRQAEIETIKQLKEAAFRNEADPLFFKFQRGEATKEQWLEKVNEIRKRFDD